MSKKQILIMAIPVVAVVALVILYQYVFQGPRDIAKETAQHHFSADAFFKVFEDGDGATYLDQVLQINGEVTEVGPKTAVLENKIQMYLNSTSTEGIEVGKSYVFKGRCVGFDDLLELVKIDQAIPTQ